MSVDNVGGDGGDAWCDVLDNGKLKTRVGGFAGQLLCRWPHVRPAQTLRAGQGPATRPTAGQVVTMVASVRVNGMPVTNQETVRFRLREHDVCPGAAARRRGLHAWDSPTTRQRGTWSPS